MFSGRDLNKSEELSGENIKVIELITAMFVKDLKREFDTIADKLNEHVEAIEKLAKRILDIEKELKHESVSETSDEDDGEITDIPEMVIEKIYEC